MFVEIAARTAASPRSCGAGSSPRAMVARARALGHEAIGIADCDGLYGMVRALEAAEETPEVPPQAGRQPEGHT